MSSRPSRSVALSSRTESRIINEPVASRALATGLTAESACRLGVLAFGDSITNGGGELQWGVALQSWAQWTARGMGLPFTSFAADGATAEHVVARQIPAFLETAAHPDARYEVGCIYI